MSEVNNYLLQRTTQVAKPDRYTRRRLTAELLLFVLMTPRLLFHSTITLSLLIFAWLDDVIEKRREQGRFLCEMDKEHAFKLYISRDYHDSVRNTLLFN